MITIMLIVISACSDKIELKEMDLTDLEVRFNRQFYGVGEQIYVSIVHNLFTDDDKPDNRHSSITYGTQTDQTNVEFHPISTRHDGNFTADLNVNKMTYKFSMPGMFSDFQLDTAITVFENRRVDFLMDKLVPKDIKNTDLEQVFIGPDKVRTPDASYLRPIPGYVGPFGSYKGIKDADYNTFLGLYGRTAIYGNHTIDSIAVRHGVLAYDENIMNMVREDILDVYDAIVVKDSENEMILETEELIFRTMAHWCWVRECDLRNVPAVVTTVKRKP